MNQNILSNLKLEGWFFLHNRRKFWSDLLKSIRILGPKQSEYWEDCTRFYSSLDVADKAVLDIGSDFGTSPMFFIKKGAKSVYGFSLDKQYFEDKNYRHYQCNNETDLCRKVRLSYPLISKSEVNPIALKMDCEGCEWNFSPEFFNGFADWVVALHNPIRSRELYDYLTSSGQYIGKFNDEEFAIYRKKVIR